MSVTSFTRKRRRGAYGAIVGIGLLLGLAAGVITYASLGSERIRQYSVDVAVQEDGTALVRETIDYDFGTNDRHGIFRDFPGYGTSGANVLSDVQVWSESAPADMELEDGSAATIRIGDPAEVVSGQHRYVIQYRVTGATSGEQLSFDVIGTGWNVPIQNADIHLTAPYRLDGVQCFRGATESQDACESFEADGGTVTAHVEDLGREQGVTIDGNGAGDLAGPVRTEFATGPELTGGRPYAMTIILVLGIGTLAFVLGVVLAVRWVRRVGRDRAWGGGGVDAVFGGPGLESAPIADATAERQVTMQFEPPRDLAPAQGGVLLTEKVERHHQVAWLTQQALDGWIAIDDGGKLLRWTAPEDTSVHPPRPLWTMFNRRRTITLGRYDKQFAEGFRELGAELRAWRANCELWDHRAESRNRVFAGLFVGLAALGVFLGAIFLYAASSPVPSLAYLAAGVSGFLAGAGLGTQLNRHELPVRSPKGFAYRQLVEGFRRFFAASEGRHARAAAERGELRLYSAWAVALGELERWNSAMVAAALPMEMAGVYEVSNIVLLNSVVHTAIQTPSSSSWGGGSSGGGSSYSGGGFDGGGSVGGGGGGGGGGSW